MKNNNIIGLTTIAFTAAVMLVACNGKKVPGKIYMPDMAYSRAVETYSLLDTTAFTDNKANLGKFIFYNRKPVEGTLAFGELADYTLPDDTTGYALSATVTNPLPPLTKADSLEAARLYNINCGICHGADGKANGPLATSGKIGGVANLTADAYIKMADGTMYHSIYYGKNNMGSYASQLSRKQRWWMVQYIRSLQPKAAPVDAGKIPAKDTAAVVVVKK